MRFKIPSLILLGFFMSLSAFSFDVTFRVNMSEVVDPFTTPEVNGTFNGWCGGCATMTDQGAGIWELVLDLAPGVYEYKFAADAWAIQENLTPGSSCTVTAGGFTNRTLTVVDQAVDLGTVCWGSCLDCGVAPPSYDVTFSVDMSQVVALFTTPEVNGTFNGWCGNCNPMTDLGGGIWETTISLPPGNYEYKFSADSWSIQETLTDGTPCVVNVGGNINRVLTVVDQNVDMGLVCYGSCTSDCNVAPPMANVSFSVDMNDEIAALTFDPINHQVVVAGGYHYPFCGVVLSDPDMDGVYTGNNDYPIQTGVAYKFYRIESAVPAVPGVTLCDNGALFEPIGSGPCIVGIDRYAVIGATTDPVVQPEVCWNSCEACGVATGPYDVTFRVDMNNVVDPFTTPEVNGTFNGWCGGCAPMTDLGGGIWETTISLNPGAYEFKFAADGWAIQETLTEGDPCTVGCCGFVNRALNVVDQNIDLGTVCWGSCTACPVPTYDVTFRVNMSEVVDPFTTPEVNGTFNGFCGGCAPMTDLGGGVWELVIALAPGTYDFKYAADTWTIQENLTPGAPCTSTVGGFTNRFVTVVDSNIDLGTVCWASCTDCDVVPPMYDVTFRVDMNNVLDPFTTPEVNGTFNGFCGGCAPMTDLGGGIWELTIALEPGDYEFKYAADTWAIQEALTPGDACTVTNFGFTNRALSVVDQNIDLGTVCWSECAACGVAPPFYDVTFRVDMSQVVDPFTTPEVNGSFNGFCGGCAPMTDLGGGIWELVIALQPGTYEFKYAADAWNIQEALVDGDPCTSTIDGFVNRSITVVDSNIDLGTVCWGSCSACVVAPTTYDVTFRVNMSEVLDPFTTPEVNGTFNGFCGGCAPMTDLGGGVWELVIALEPGFYEFKYAADTWTIQENLSPGSACTITTGAFTNRSLTVVDQDIDLGTVCWGSCYDCGVLAPIYDVTFRVDMSQVVDPFTTPEVNGNFNGWCGGCAPMTDLGGGVWELTIPLEVGNYEFKYAADAWTIQENLTPGDACTVTADGFTNRFVSVVDQNIDLGTVCWASCSACIASTAGCTYANADNYDMNATEDDGSCIYAGCTNATANNYNPFANSDNGTCNFSPDCPADLNGDNVINTGDLNALLGVYGSTCP